jgi:probable FeS assembly SUF system protein SufT
METIELKRDCNVIAIPSGLSQVLPSGTSVRIVQARGCSYTIATQFHAMYRIDAADADALGLEAPAAPDAGQQEPFSEKLVWNTLKRVFDPEIPINIVDLGLVYSCEIRPCERGNAIKVRMSMTAPGCGMSNVLKADVENKLLRIPEVVEVRVEVVFDPPWNPERMSEAARLQLGFDLEPSSPAHLAQIT